ncbi:MAG: hypothetical protein U0575_07455 [Phycisphaerales bacterium]
MPMFLAFDDLAEPSSSSATAITPPTSARGAPATFLWFSEEVGEPLAARRPAAATRTAATSMRSSPTCSRRLATLANITGAWTTEASGRGYLDDGGPKGTK